MLAFLKQAETEQKAKRKKSNDVTNQRKRDRIRSAPIPSLQ